MDLGIVFYYLYSLIIIVIFFRNCRNLAFLRVTLVYFVFITFFACLLLYGSSYSLEAQPAWYQHGPLAAFPFLITGAAPDANTISKTTFAYWFWTGGLIAFFVTFPQAVLRGARLHLSEEYLPEKVVSAVKQHAAWLERVLPHITGTLGNVYALGEGVFFLVVLSSLVSPYPSQNWFLMLVGCFFVILLAGNDLVRGTGPLSFILKLIIPGLVGAAQRLAAFIMMVVLVLTSLVTALLAASIFDGVANLIFQTENLSSGIVIVILLMTVGVFILSLTLFRKILLFPIHKLVEWMEIEITDELKEFVGELSV